VAVTSRNELEKRLPKLDKDKARLNQKWPNEGDFFNPFAGDVFALNDNASAADAAWAYERTDATDDTHGFSAEPDEGPRDG
jgi:hypothetical protein